MNNAIEVLFLRRPRIDYISPPICEAIFSASGGPVIVLNPLSSQGFPTGLILGGSGSFFLSWDNYPGALCYSIYKADSSDPFGSYTIVAECIPNPPFDTQPFGAGCYRISAITANGETPLSIPTCTSSINPPVLPEVVTNAADNIQEASARLNGFVSPHGNTTSVHFEWGLTTAYGNVTGIQSTGVAETAFLDSIASLSVNTTYHFRAVASNIAGTVTGVDRSFTTLASGGCPSGDNTPCDLSVPGAGVLGTLTPGLAGGDSNLGALPPGNYTLKYTSGAFHNDDNPCPFNITSLWKFVGYSVSTNGTPVLDWLDPVLSLCSASEANLAADVRAFRETYDFVSTGETWGIFFGIPGGGTNPVAGSPLPTWQVIQNSTFPVQPDRVRIVDFNPAVFSVCASQPDSVNPAWDGTMPSSFLAYPDTFVWDSDSNKSLNGKRMDFAEVTYVNDSSAPTPTGCGWLLQIYGHTDDVWLGYKSTGTGPEGCYSRASGCSAGPTSVYIESY